MSADDLDAKVRAAMVRHAGACAIPLPDAPIRQRAWFQIYCRLARPTLDWVGVYAAAWALFLGDQTGQPMAEGARLIVLGFVAALYGVRTFEKTKGVA